MKWLYRKADSETKLEGFLEVPEGISRECVSICRLCRARRDSAEVILQTTTIQKTVGGWLTFKILLILGGIYAHFMAIPKQQSTCQTGRERAEPPQGLRWRFGEDDTFQKYAEHTSMAIAVELDSHGKGRKFRAGAEADGVLCKLMTLAACSSGIPSLHEHESRQYYCSTLKHDSLQFFASKNCVELARCSQKPSSVILSWRKQTCRDHCDIVDIAYATIWAT